MSEGRAARAIRLLDGTSSDVIEGGLLTEPHELWDRDRTRLTVLFEPGRIKRGLRPQLESGRALRKGRPVAVEVTTDFLDAGGRPLAAPARHDFRVGAAVNLRVDPGRWRWRMPPAGSRAPLVATFDRPLDHFLLLGCLRVICHGRGEVAGQAATANDDRGWTFQPDVPWDATHRYAVLIDPRLEDLAGNNMSRVFDRNLDRPADAPRARQAILLDLPALE
jgi:hypothetical protein